MTNIGKRRRPIEDVQLMDEGMALSLEPLDGYIVNFFDNGAERSTSFKFGPSDAFQRIYNYRLSKKMGVRELRDRKKKNCFL